MNGAREVNTERTLDRAFRHHGRSVEYEVSLWMGSNVVADQMEHVDRAKTKESEEDRLDEEE